MANDVTQGAALFVSGIAASGSRDQGQIEYHKLDNTGFNTIASGQETSEIIITNIIAGGSTSKILFKSSKVQNSSDESGNLLLALPANETSVVNYKSPVKLTQGADLQVKGGIGTVVSVTHHEIAHFYIADAIIDFDDPDAIPPSIPSGSILTEDGLSWLLWEDGNFFLEEDATPAAFANTYSVGFDGADDYMSADGAAVNMASNTVGTISLWIKAADASPSNTKWAVSFGDNSSNSYVSFGIKPNPGFTNCVIHSLAALNGTNQWSYTTTANTLNWLDNEWHHIVIVQNGSVPVIYLDGTLHATSQVIGTDPTYWLSDFPACDKFSAGALVKNGTDTFEWDGALDEVAVWDTALSSFEVALIYNGGTPTDLTSLSPVGWWRMGDDDGGVGTTITDQGSGENNGTLNNGAAIQSDVPS
jgi:hypothetical protein